MLSPLLHRTTMLYAFAGLRAPLVEFGISQKMAVPMQHHVSVRIADVVKSLA